MMIIIICFFSIILTGCVSKDLDNYTQNNNRAYTTQNNDDKIREKENTEISYKSNLPPCSNQQFTTPFVPFNSIKEIVPLGNLYPPDHTIPTEHTYVVLTSLEIPLQAPSNIYITKLSSTDYLKTGETDYTINFALCQDIQGYFTHVKSIPLELKRYLNDCKSSTYGDGKYKNCWIDVNELPISAGEIIGSVGDDTQDNFDFGMYDLRLQVKSANPDRYANQIGWSPLHAICPYDLYNEQAKKILYNKLVRTQEPRCGQAMQDIHGTLQGNWYYNGENTDKWTNQLSFVHDNLNPGKAAISIGGIFMDASLWQFMPTQSGQINREFSQITPSNELYCYDQGQIGKIIVQLKTKNELRIEYQSGECKKNFSFKHYTAYIR